jgi:hypothetical protein
MKTLIFILSLTLASQAASLPDSLSLLPVNPKLETTIKPKKEIPLWLDALIALFVVSTTAQCIGASYHK